MQFDWAGKRATRVGRGLDASSQPIWADKRLFLKWDEWLQQPHLTRHNHVAQRLCTWGPWYKPSVPASPAERRCYPSDTSGGRPLTEAMISYPERASARRWRCTSYHLRQGNGVGTTTVCGAYSQPGHLYHLAGMIWRRRCNGSRIYAGDTAYADRAALWKEDGAARCHSDSRIIAHHGTTQGE